MGRNYFAITTTLQVCGVVALTRGIREGKVCLLSAMTVFGSQFGKLIARSNMRWSCSIIRLSYAPLVPQFFVETRHKAGRTYTAASLVCAPSSTLSFSQFVLGHHLGKSNRRLELELISRTFFYTD